MEFAQYYKDRIKTAFFRKVSGLNARAKTGMHTLLLELKIKGLLPKNIRALEMFGMHGLWHTMDYVPFVEHLDIFEINEKYHELSKKNLKGFPVDFQCADSIAFVESRPQPYDLVVSDIPFGGDFYNQNGLPKFLPAMIEATAQKGVLIFNIHSSQLVDFNTFTGLIRAACGSREVVDLFYTPRNEWVTYTTIVFG